MNGDRPKLPFTLALYIVVAHTHVFVAEGVHEAVCNCIGLFLGEETGAYLVQESSCGKQRGCTHNRVQNPLEGHVHSFIHICVSAGIARV